MGAFEVKTHFSALLNEVEKGEQIIITKHGRSVAKLIPIGNLDRKRTSEAIQLLKQFAKQHSLGGLDWKTLRDEGRK